MVKGVQKSTKVRNFQTYTALGSVISRKWTDCAWNLTNLPLGNSVPVIRIGSPSLSLSVLIIQYGKWTTPSSAINSKTPACVDAAGFAGFRSWNIHGEARSRFVRFARAEGGRITIETLNQCYDVTFRMMTRTFTTIRNIFPFSPRKHCHAVSFQILIIRLWIGTSHSRITCWKGTGFRLSQMSKDECGMWAPSSQLVEDPARTIRPSKL